MNDVEMKDSEKKHEEIWTTSVKQESTPTTDLKYLLIKVSV